MSNATIDNLLGYETIWGRRLKLDEFGHFEAGFLSVYLSLPEAREVAGTEHVFMDGRGLTYTLEGLTKICRSMIEEDWGDIRAAWDYLTILGETNKKGPSQ